jgi:hypothetical protein
VYTARGDFAPPTFRVNPGGRGATRASGGRGRAQPKRPQHLEMYNPAEMNLLQQTFQPVDESKHRQWLGFRFSDDDFSLRTSVYLGLSEGRAELVEDVTQVLRAYGFTNFTRINQAPGSFFFSILVRFGTNNREAAHKSKQQLQKDLLSDVLPRRPPPKAPCRPKIEEVIVESHAEESENYHRSWMCISWKPNRRNI